MNFKVYGLSPNKNRERVLEVEYDKDGVWLTISPKGAKLTSTGYSIFMTFSEFQKFKQKIAL